MKTYKNFIDANGDVWGYPDDGSQDDLIPATHSRIPDADFDVVLAESIKLRADTAKGLPVAAEKVSLRARIVNFVIG